MDLERLSSVEERIRAELPLSKWTHIDTSHAGAEDKLKVYGIDIYGPSKHNAHSFFFYHPPSPQHRISVQFDETTENLFVIENPAHLAASFYIRGPRNTFAATGSPNMPGPIVLRIEYHGEKNSVFFGKGSTSNGTRIVVQGGRSVDIQEDCMFADGVTIRTTDNHAVIDAQTGTVLNHTADVTIGRHVWLCQDVIVLRGAQIGAGSIIGARSVVTRNLPSGVLAHGSPARPSREGVGWTRNLHPSPTEKLTALQYAV